MDHRAAPMSAPIAGPTSAKSASSAPKTAQGGRLAWIERLRLIAMFEIVGFHLLVPGRLPLVAALGLSIFLLLGAAFSVQAAERRGAWAVADAKLRTVGVAWLFWSACFLALRGAFALYRGQSLLPLLDPWMFIAGVRSHLWFAPFAVFAGAASAALHVATRGWPRGARTAGFVALALLSVPLCDRLNGGTQPLPQWAFALPSIPWGFALGSLLFAKGKERSRYALAFAALAVVVLAALPVLHQVGGAAVGSISETLRRYAVSTLLIVGAAMLGGSLDPVTRRIAPYMLGVYFVHMFFLDFLRGRLPSGPWLGTAIVFGLALLTVEMLQRTQLRRFVVMQARK